MRIACHLLQSFVTAVHEGSFSRASTQLGISASSLSDRIRSLEDQLGFQLFHRTTRRTQITRHGRSFLVYAESMLAVIDDMEAAAAEIAGAAVGEIVIGAGPYGGRERHAVIDRFRQRNPNIAIRMVIDPDQSKLFTMLHNGDIDLLFAWGANANQPAERSCGHGVEVGLLVPDGERFPDRPVLQTTDLRGAKIVSSSQHFSGPVYSAFETLAEANDVEIIDIPCDHAAEIVAYARRAGFPVVCCAEFGTPAWPIDGVSFRQWSDLSAQASFHLYRDPFCASRLARRFWNEARPPQASSAALSGHV